MKQTSTYYSVSPREYQVLNLLSNGYSSKDIALHLYVSPNTIKDHRKALLRKLNARNVAQMIRKAFELELLKTA